MSKRKEQIQRITASIQGLSEGQLMWIERTAGMFGTPVESDLTPSDLFPVEVLNDFGDTLLIHHAFSREAFSKDKFEYALEQLCRLRGIQASLARSGNPGHDVTINGVKISLKTQADKKLKSDELFISKFMEMGKGPWTNKISQLEGFRDRFLNHLNRYDRIFCLRTLIRPKSPVEDDKGETVGLTQEPTRWKYELVEIPKAIFLEAEVGEFKFSRRSKAKAKVGYCYVPAEKGKRYALYFDGGTERKLQIKYLKKKLCMVHATWCFVIPPVV